MVAEEYSYARARATRPLWMASGGYDSIAGALFERARSFDACFLD
jgi:hypothetical protein